MYPDPDLPPPLEEGDEVELTPDQEFYEELADAAYADEPGFPSAQETLNGRPQNSEEAFRRLMRGE